MTITIKQAQARVRSHKGCSFLTHGGDDFAHNGLNKARRAMDRAAINEQLVEDEVPEDEADVRWVVEAYLCDGDKWWLDSYEVVLITSDFDEADRFCQEWDAKDYETTDGRPAPKTRLEWRDVKGCWDCQYWLRYQCQPSKD